MSDTNLQNTYRTETLSPSNTISTVKRMFSPISSRFKASQCNKTSAKSPEQMIDKRPTMNINSLGLFKQASSKLRNETKSE